MSARARTIEESKHVETQSSQMARLDELFSDEQLVANYLAKNSPLIDYGKVMKMEGGEKMSLYQKSMRRPVWEEMDCSNGFPPTPEAANLTTLQYLEQRDMWERRQVLHIPKFCVGSIVEVTLADEWMDEGWKKFIGLCIHINNKHLSKGHCFILRNVIKDGVDDPEAVEFRIPFYNPHVQKIEVKLHQKWENEHPHKGLRFLRDYPLEFCQIKENPKGTDYPVYSEEPKIRKWTKEDKEKVVQHFTNIFHSRSGHKKFKELPELFQRGFEHI